MENQHQSTTENNITNNTLCEGAIEFNPTVFGPRYPVRVNDYASLYHVLYEEDLIKHPHQVTEKVLSFDLYQRITSKKISSKKEKYICALKNYIKSANLVLTPKFSEQLYTDPVTTEKLKKVFSNSLHMYGELNLNRNYCWFTQEEKTNGFECPICYEKIVPNPNKIFELKNIHV